MFQEAQADTSGLSGKVILRAEERLQPSTGQLAGCVGCIWFTDGTYLEVYSCECCGGFGWSLKNTSQIGTPLAEQCK